MKIHPCPIVPVSATTRARVVASNAIPYGWADAAMGTWTRRVEMILLVTNRSPVLPRRCYVWRPKFAGASAVRP
jgi:hypothetical protein